MPCACGNDHKYTCPACGAQTCSMDCSKTHKASTGCTGVLDPTRYIPRGELLTPTGLNRDYNFLQKLGRDIHVEAPEFKRRARDFVRNNVKVRSMPPQMSRAKQNKSGWNKATQTYLWTVEVRKEIHKGGEIRQVPDTDTIQQITGVSLATLIDADGTKITIGGDKTLSQALDDQVIAEFPTIYCGVVEPAASESDFSESSGSSDSDSSDSSSDSESESDEAPLEESYTVPDTEEPPQLEKLGGDELASLIEETQAVLETKEPDTLKPVLIEELEPVEPIAPVAEDQADPVSSVDA